MILKYSGGLFKWKALKLFMWLLIVTTKTVEAQKKEIKTTNKTVKH